MKAITDSFRGFNVHALDGRIGSLKDFYFDYASWKLSHLSVQWRKGLYRKFSLLPIEKIKTIDVDSKILNLNTLKHHIKNGPRVRPVKAITAKYYEHYWKHYYDVPDRPKPIKFSGPYSPLFLEPSKSLVQNQKYYPLQLLHGLSVNGFDGKMGVCIATIIDCERLFVKSLVYRHGLWPLSVKKKLGLEWLRKIDWDSGQIFFEINKKGNTSRFSPDQEATKLTANIAMDYTGNLEISSEVKKISPNL